MRIPVIEKSSTGEFPIGLQYYPPDVEVGEVISSVTATVSPLVSGTGLIIGTPGKSDKGVYVKVSGGTVDVDYIVQFKVTTSSGKIFNHPILDAIKVRVVD